MIEQLRTLFKISTINLFASTRSKQTQERVEESRWIRSHTALSASLNFCCICCTQSLPCTSNRAIIRGSVSSFAASNSFRASSFRRLFQGLPFGSHQWNARQVRRISRYKLSASRRVVCDLKCRAAVEAAPVVIIVGGIWEGGECGRSFGSGAVYGWDWDKAASPIMGKIRLLSARWSTPWLSVYQGSGEMVQLA